MSVPSHGGAAARVRSDDLEDDERRLEAALEEAEIQASHVITQQKHLSRRADGLVVLAEAAREAALALNHVEVLARALARVKARR